MKNKYAQLGFTSLHHQIMETSSEPQREEEELFLLEKLVNDLKECKNLLFGTARPCGNTSGRVCECQAMGAVGSGQHTLVKNALGH